MMDELAKVGGNVGNVWPAFGDGTRPSVLLSAHMDTVMPGCGVSRSAKRTGIRSDGSTILGADDNQLAIILEVLDVLKKERFCICRSNRFYDL
jgi:tripeptide aminopeptidase